MKTATILAAVTILSVGAGGYAVVRVSVESLDRGWQPIVRAELDKSPTANVYDAVTELRTDWLAQASPDRAATEPTVFIELRCKDVACLRWIDASQVERIEYLANGTAVRPKHQHHTGAAIVVLMRSRALGLNVDSTET